MAAADLSAHRARELLAYNAETGELRWRFRRSNAVAADTVAGTQSKDGYAVVQIDGASYLCHRLAVLLMTGAWPDGEVDHMNGVRTDNRWINLRVVTRSMNMQNKRRAQSNNRSGLLGAHFDKTRGKFKSTININGRQVHLGWFDNAEEAHDAYVVRKRQVHPGSTL